MSFDVVRFQSVGHGPARMGHETAAWDCELAPKINAKDSARPGARSFCGTASPPSGASVKPQLRRPCRLLIPARPVIHLAAAALATLHPRPKPRDRRVIRIAPDVGRSRTRPVRRPCRGRSHRIQSELAPTWGFGWTGGFARRGICTGSSGGGAHWRGLVRARNPWLSSNHQRCSRSSRAWRRKSFGERQRQA
jgi:hypothetical protein